MSVSREGAKKRKHNKKKMWLINLLLLKPHDPEDLIAKTAHLFVKNTVEHILPMPRHCVEPGAVILHAAPLTVTKMTPTPIEKRDREAEKREKEKNMSK